MIISIPAHETRAELQHTLAREIRAAEQVWITAPTGQPEEWEPGGDTPRIKAIARRIAALLLSTTISEVVSTDQST